MPDTDWLRRQMELVRELLRLADERREGRLFAARHRAESERVAEVDFRERMRVNRETSRQRRKLARKNDHQRRRFLLSAIEGRREALAAKGVSVHSEVVLTVPEDVQEKAQDDLREALWSASALFEGAEAAALSSFKINTMRLDEATERIASMRGVRDWKVSSYPAVRHLVKAATPEPPRLRGGDLNERLAESERFLEQFTSHEPKVYTYWPALLGPLVLASILAYPAWRFLGNVRGPAVVLGAALVLGIALALRAHWKAARPMATDILDLDRTLIEAEAALNHKARRLKRRLHLRNRQNTRRREEQEKQARKVFARAVRPREDAEDRREAVRVRKRLGVLDACRKHIPVWSHEHLGRRLISIRDQRRREVQRAREDYQSILEVIAECARSDIAAVDQIWHDGWAKVCAGVAAIDRDCPGSVLSWDSPDWSRWTPPTSFPPFVRIGDIELNLDLGPELPRSSASLPLALPTAEPQNIVFESTTDEDRLAVVEALNAVMMRFVTSLPPGKLLLTILDPSGLGASLAEFMHLADHAESLVSYRIWNGSEPLSASLSDLTEPLERGVQGDQDVYRMLVVADFPVGFDEQAVERLAQILEEGPRSRVFTLLGVDSRKGVDMGFLESLALVLRRREGRFHGGKHILEDSPLAIDPPAHREIAARLLTLVGRAAADLEVSASPLRVLT